MDVVERDVEQFDVPANVGEDGPHALRAELALVLGADVDFLGVGRVLIAQKLLKLRDMVGYAHNQRLSIVWTTPYIVFKHILISGVLICA